MKSLSPDKNIFSEQEPEQMTEVVTKSFAGFSKMGLYRFGGDIEFLCNLLLRITLVMLQAEDDPAFFRQRIDRQLKIPIEFVVVDFVKSRFIYPR
jgi:hypothetical protein